MPVVNENGRTLAGVITELKDELKDFVQTRIDIARSELRDKVKAWKAALPLIAIGLVLLGTAWLVLTAALIAIIAFAFAGHPLAYFFAFVIVGLAYALAGAVCATFAWHELSEQGVVPHRTVQVLKDDKVWLQTEARSQI
jgi:hypothetical protein